MLLTKKLLLYIINYDALQIFNQWIIIIVDNNAQIANRAYFTGPDSVGLC